MKTLGPLIILSGPSGSGKSTLVQRVMGRSPIPLRLAVSVTTRPPRTGEIDGVHYHFRSPEWFRESLARGEFLEHAVVHGVNYYGTPRSEVDGFRERGIGVILDIDVQGAALVRPLYPDHISVFVKLSDERMYADRLRARGTDDEATIARRMQTMRQEMARVGEYRHVLVNDDLDAATDDFLKLLAPSSARAAG